MWCNCKLDYKSQDKSVSSFKGILRLESCVAWSNQALASQGPSRSRGPAVSDAMVATTAGPPSPMTPTRKMELKAKEADGGTGPTPNRRLTVGFDAAQAPREGFDSVKGDAYTKKRSKRRSFQQAPEDRGSEVLLQAAEAAEAAAMAQRHAAAKARANLEVQRKRRAHDEAIERDRARHRTAINSCSSTTSGPHVSCGVVVLTPLVEAHRRYVAAGAALALPSCDREAAMGAARERFGALCAAWGVRLPPAEVLVTGSTSAATVVGIQASDEPALDSATREAKREAVAPDSTLVPAPTAGGGCCIGALGVITVCTAIGWAVVAGESGRGQPRS